MHNTTTSYERIEPDDLDLGEDVTDEVIIRQPTGVVISVRLSQVEAGCLAVLARRNGTGVVEAAHAAIISAVLPFRGPASSARADDPEGENIHVPLVEEELVADERHDEAGYVHLKM